MSVPQWNADIITPASKGTQVIGDNNQPQETLEGGDNITIEDGVISASGGLEQEQANWAETDTEDPSFIRNKPTIPAVDQVYDGTSTNAQSGTAVAGAINTVNQVPASTSSDADKVLTVDAQGVPGWATPATPTVDQTYDSTSTNAQSGTAVAGALAGVNQVPASTSADASKVLTVDSQGVPGWVTPAAPAGGDSGEWWGGDPGYTPNIPIGTARLRFKDTTYDPRNDPDSTFIAKFNSITKVSDGVYDFACKNDQTSMFYSKYTTDNEFIIIGLNINFNRCDYMFSLCTGLRAVYNLEANIGSNCANMFKGCTNLMEVRCGINNNSYTFTPGSNCTSMFSNCSRLKTVNMFLDISSYTNRNLGSLCSNCYDLEVGPSFGANVTNCSHAFSGCSKLRRFTTPSSYSGDTYIYNNNVNCTQMFSGCQSLQSMNGLGAFFLGVTSSNASQMFNNCVDLQEVPYVKLEDGANCSYMFNRCCSLKKVPDMDWGNIANMSNMFKFCSTLASLNNKDSGTQWYDGTLNASLTDVSSMFNKCFGIKEHLLDCYNGLSANAGITSTSDCFTNCGVAWNNPDLAQIPSSWGGDAT